jgi:eukaryotic-like serine/threonine-protein kinase
MAASGTRSALSYTLRDLLHKPFVLVVVGLLVLFLLLNYIVLPAYVNHGSRLSVPSVIGKPLPEARTTLESANLRVVEADTRPDAQYPPGTVIQQNPAAGAIVKEDRHIYLTLSGGEVQVTIPSLRGRSLRDARFALDRFGLKVGSVAYDTSDTYPENTIIEQRPAPESRVTRGSSVDIVVSRGHIPSAAQAPLLIGKTVTEAEKILDDAGLKRGIINYQPSFDLVPNTVVDQYPRPGEPLGPGQAVDLFVIKDGRPVEEIEIPAP